MKKINTLKIVKAVSITAISSALIFGLTSCDLTAKGIEILLEKLKEKHPKQYEKIKKWLKEQKYTEDTNYKIKDEIQKLEANGDPNEILSQLRSFRTNENEISDELPKYNGLETKKNPKTQSPESITYGNKEDININFLNRLKYQENDFQYNKNEDSFKNKKYHNFDGLRYSFSTYPYLKNNPLYNDLFNSAPIYHMLYNSYSPISFKHRCKKGLIKMSWKDITEYNLDDIDNKNNDPKYQAIKTLKAHIKLWTKYFGNELIVKAIIEGLTAEDLINSKITQLNTQKKLDDWINNFTNRIKNEEETIKKFNNLTDIKFISPIKGQSRKFIKISFRDSSGQIQNFKILAPNNFDDWENRNSLDKDIRTEKRPLFYQDKTDGKWKKFFNNVFIHYELTYNALSGNFSADKIKEITYNKKEFTDQDYINLYIEKDTQNNHVTKIKTKDLNIFFHILPLLQGFERENIKVNELKLNTDEKNSLQNTETFKTKWRSIKYWQEIDYRDGIFIGGKSGLIDVTLTPEMIMEPNFLFKEKDILWMYKNFNLNNFANKNKDYILTDENKSLRNYITDNFSCFNARTRSEETFVFLFKVAKWRLDILNSYALTILELKKDYSWIKRINELSGANQNLDSWFDYKVKTTTSIFEDKSSDKDYRIIDADNKRPVRIFKKKYYKKKRTQ